MGNKSMFKFGRSSHKIGPGTIVSWDMVSDITNNINDNTMRELTKEQKKELSPEMQALVQAGFYDNDLELNYDYHGCGMRSLLEILAEEYKDKLVEKAKEQIAEHEAKQEKKNCN